MMSISKVVACDQLEFQKCKSHHVQFGPCPTPPGLGLGPVNGIFPSFFLSVLKCDERSLFWHGVVTPQ